jgi:hypothetical protein
MGLEKRPVFGVVNTRTFSLAKNEFNLEKFHL